VTQLIITTTLLLRRFLIYLRERIDVVEPPAATPSAAVMDRSEDCDRAVRGVMVERYKLRGVDPECFVGSTPREECLVEVDFLLLFLAFDFRLGLFDT